MKKILFIILLVLGAYLLWRWWSGNAETASRGQELVYDRLWVDHLPKTETDEIKIFAAITDEPIGIFQATSVWRGAFELFRYENQGDGKIVLMYPQTKEKERAAYRATKCSEAGFDFCMELSGASRGGKRYYSQKGWELGAHSARALESRVTDLVRGLPAAR